MTARVVDACPWAELGHARARAAQSSESCSKRRSDCAGSRWHDPCSAEYSPARTRAAPRDMKELPHDFREKILRQARLELEPEAYEELQDTGDQDSPKSAI